MTEEDQDLGSQLARGKMRRYQGSGDSIDNFRALQSVDSTDLASDKSHLGKRYLIAERLLQTLEYLELHL